MATLFISDLHLSPERPEIVRLFGEFLAGPARSAEALYILGDLFEYWAGDDDLANAFNTSIVAALAACARSIPVTFMRGNRDFLVAERFAHQSRMRIAEDARGHGITPRFEHGTGAARTRSAREVASR